ncbi:MAG: undecaprenyldiphospho-muramoylpentapeptide beta-N-acetylglucosaminyltransferase [Peptococcaceae bacterium]|nr:undecaprenyldiphospho-muramoylpentapeptide beta-N-acetylglucosaminyltransferase [Peptococcaceae bacterium]
MRVIVSGGGTGGHIYPALAIAERIVEDMPGSEVLYIGCDNGLENNIVPKTAIPFKTISAKGLPRKLSLGLFKSLFVNVKGVFEAKRYIKDFKPDLVIGTGGFVCGPTVLMACLNHIPAMIHEQNAYPGMTNRLLSSRVNKVMVNYPEAAKFFVKAKETVLTGLPVREDIGKISKEEGCAKFSLDPAKKTVLITGGSRGARTINRVSALALPGILANENVQVIFITGKAGYVDTSLMLKENDMSVLNNERLRFLEYSHEMPYALAAADVVVGRAGATFLAEIAACGLPGILVPYPYASDNHQQFNAQAVVDANAGEMILDGEMTVPKLTATLNRFITDDAYYQEKKGNMQKLARPTAMDDIMMLVKSFSKSIKR